MLIIENWDDVAPVIKAVWQEIDNVAQEMGGWETVIEGLVWLWLVLLPSGPLVPCSSPSCWPDGFPACWVKLAGWGP